MLCSLAHGAARDDLLLMERLDDQRSQRIIGECAEMVGMMKEQTGLLGIHDVDFKNVSLAIQRIWRRFDRNNKNLTPPARKRFKSHSPPEAPGAPVRHGRHATRLTRRPTGLMESSLEAGDTEGDHTYWATAVAMAART